ncbi:MAG TPA: TonB-dependent receptor, partial [Asticcacaulis sp.]|nr:TonB-dependent receptor [Asticcacaulis sp.]
HQGLDLSAIYNYVGSETDTGVSPQTKIASWGTLDLNLSYRLRSGEAAQGPRLSLAVSNLFDKRPPYAESANLAIGGIYFDSTNASAIGRFVSVALTQVW